MTEHKIKDCLTRSHEYGISRTEWRRARSGNGNVATDSVSEASGKSTATAEGEARAARPLSRGRREIFWRRKRLLAMHHRRKDFSQKIRQ